MTSTRFAVLAEGLTKRYGGNPALAGFDLAVPAGTVYALLGPNGAGKTTAVRILTTLLRYDAGRAEVAGLDVARHDAAVRRRIGLVGQNAAVDEVLTGRQNLVMFGRLHHLGRRRATGRAEELLLRFGLSDAADRPVKQYSGGMRRRLDLAAGVIAEPEVLFLDEPTTGLDPRGREEVWEVIRALVAGGATALLTTQYLEEADRLADRISVIEAGRVVAHGTPEQLKARVGQDRLDLVLRRTADVPSAVALLARVAGAEPRVDTAARRLTVPVTRRVAVLTQVVRDLADSGIEIEDVGLRRPTLDEVFLRLTGTGRAVGGRDGAAAGGGGAGGAGDGAPDAAGADTEGVA